MAGVYPWSFGHHIVFAPKFLCRRIYGRYCRTVNLSLPFQGVIPAALPGQPGHCPPAPPLPCRFSPVLSEGDSSKILLPERREEKQPRRNHQRHVPFFLTWRNDQNREFSVSSAENIM